MSRLLERYDKDHPPIQCFMTNAKWYKQSGSFTPRGILWHDTGADNPWLKRYVQPDDDAPNKAELIALIGKNTYGNDWNHGGKDKDAGLNCWVGKLNDGTVTTLQAGPWTKRPWGCGSGSSGKSLNDTHIQWEICQDAKKDIDYFADVYQESIAVSAYLCTLFDLDPHGMITYKGIKVPVVCCHWDAANLGCGSYHDDIYDWTVMYDYLGIPRKSVNVNDPYNNLIFQRIRDDIAHAMEPEPVIPDGWKQIDGKWYYYKDGKPIKSQWIQYKADWYYLGADGVMLTGWAEIDGKKYHFAESGAMSQDEWIDGRFCTMGGVCSYKYLGEWKSNSKGKWFEDASGWYPRGRSVRIDGIDYAFDSNGYLKK